MKDPSLSIGFDPIKAEHLGSDWQVGFGQWQVAGGRLRHVLPGGPDPTEKLAIAGSGLASELARLATVSHTLPDGGFERTHVTLDASLQVEGSFFVALDEWAVEWAPDFGMRPVLTDIGNGSRGHECAGEPWGPPDTTHRIELIGERDTITFRCDGRELFSARRHFARPYRKITVSSYAGASMAAVRIEGDHAVAARQPARRLDRPLLAALVDFSDDFIYAPFTAELIDLLVERLAELDIGRIYWMNTVRVVDDVLGPNADSQLSGALDKWRMCKTDRGTGPTTVRNCYPFLPKAVEAAHRHGMQIYAVLKTFDLGTNPPLGDPSPFVNEQFRIEHPDAFMQRWKEPGAAADDPAGRPVTTIRFYSANLDEHGIRPEQITVWCSDDNESYQRVDPPPKIAFGIERKRFARLREGDQTEPRDVRTITIDGMRITAKYFAVTIDGDRACTFLNRIYRLAEALDADGRAVPMTRNMPEYPRAGESSWRGEGGFVFDGFTTARQPTGCWYGPDWIERVDALDGIDRGIAFQRGLRERISGAPDPTHPRVTRYWLDWVQESLDAGVDGIDMRIIHHNNPLDWANYGFGPNAEAEYQRRFNTPLRPEAACREQHAKMFGDLYTEFVREASRITRDHGAKMQHHVSVPMDCPPHLRPMTNIHWQWQRWMEEGLLDAVTLKNLEPDSGFFDEVMAATEEHGVEAIHCPYLNCILCASDTWKQQLSAVVQGVTDKGMDGLILYESASFLNADDAGDIKEVFPGLREILRPQSPPSAV